MAFDGDASELPRARSSARRGPEASRIAEGAGYLASPTFQKFGQTDGQ